MKHIKKNFALSFLYNRLHIGNNFKKNIFSKIEIY